MVGARPACVCGNDVGRQKVNAIGAPPGKREERGQCTARRQFDRLCAAVLHQCVRAALGCARTRGREGARVLRSVVSSRGSLGFPVWPACALTRRRGKRPRLLAARPRDGAPEARIRSRTAHWAGHIGRTAAAVVAATMNPSRAASQRPPKPAATMLRGSGIRFAERSDVALCIGPAGSIRYVARTSDIRAPHPRACPAVRGSAAAQHGRRRRATAGCQALGVRHTAAALTRRLSRTRRCVHAWCVHHCDAELRGPA